MNTRRHPLSPGSSVLTVSLAAAFAVAALSSEMQAQPKKKNPSSKVYISDVSGEATIDTGDVFEDLTKRSVYTAQGTTIETKKAETESEREKYFSTMVYSNGTGAFFDADTRVEVRRFVQEPFTPNRTDVEVEPSISQTQAFVSRGTVGLCTSKLVAGSNMNYHTPLGSVSIRGRKIVIESGTEVTKISMLEGESTVRAGAMDMGGHTLHAGEQAVIRKMGPGQPNQIEIHRIPPQEAAPLDDKVAMACMAKKTVYFEERERTVDNRDPNSSEKGDGGSDSTGGGSNGGVTAFDGNSGSGSSVTVREIVPIEVVPVNLPVQFTVSPAQIITPGRGPGG